MIPPRAQPAGVRILLGFILLALLSTVVKTGELYNPFVTTKALWFRTFVMLALPVYIYLILSRPEFRPNLKNPLTIAVGAFLTSNILSAVLGVNPGRSFWGTYERMGGVYQLLHLTLFYFSLLLLSAANVRFTKAALRLLVWLAALSGVYGVAQWFSPHSAALADLGGRSSSLYGNPIYFADSLTLPMALALFFWQEARAKISKTLYILLFAAGFLGVLSSGTRGVMVAFATAVWVGGVLLALNMSNAFRRCTAIGLLIVGAVGLIFAIAHSRQAPPKNLGRLANLSDRTRLIQWRVAWSGYHERPLVGVGPENYYVIDNKYFDREMYKYKGESSDKPHNYALEVLTTTGLGGFIAYVSVFVLALLAFWRGFQAKRISRVQCIILVCGAVAYHVQSLFAFETPAAAIAFYAYLAFAAHLSSEIRPQEARHRSRYPGSVVMRTVCFVAAGSVFLVLLTDVAAAVALRDLEYGRGIGLRDAASAKSYFDKAVGSRFVFDRASIAGTYQQFAVHLVEDEPGPVDTAFVNSTLEAASIALEQATSDSSSDPVLWLKLANLEILRAKLNGTALDARAYAAVRQAISLEPERVEPLYSLAQCYAIVHRGNEAIAAGQRAVHMIPENPTARWQLAQVYWTLNQDQLAAQSAEEAMRLGYKFTSVKQLLTLVNYHLQNQNYDKVADLYKTALKLQPNDARLYASLAATYAKSGFKQGARDAARAAVRLNPSLEQAMREFLQTLE